VNAHHQSTDGRQNESSLLILMSSCLPFLSLFREAVPAWETDDTAMITRERFVMHFL